MAGVLNQIKVAVFNLLPRSWMTIKSRDSGTICLTYDDGPHPEVTPQLLELLKQKNAKATFFLVGHAAKAYPEIVRQIAADGHTLGNHSYFHKEFHKLPVAAQMQEIQETNALLQQITGRPCNLFRAPAGKFSAPLFGALVKAKITFAHWTRDTQDYTLDEQGVVAGLLRQPLSDRDVVLMHDDHRKVVAITDHILSQYKDYRFTAM